MTKVDILDRSDMTERLMAALTIDARETAIVTIDMHRGHLDPEIATMPASREDSERVIAHATELLGFARAHGISVIHVILIHRRIPGRGTEASSQPFWRAVADIRDANNRLSPGRPSTTLEHNLEGMPGTEIIPALYREGDFVINNKKRLDCFMGTDLDMLLQHVGAKTVCLMGINTNTCVMNTAFTAFNKDYRVVVLSDCVASMYGEDLHVLGLQNVARCLGWVVDNPTFRAKVDGRPAANSAERVQQLSA